MIDVHCHLEQKDYDQDRDSILKNCKKELTAVIISCANPKNFDVTMKLVEENKNFLFATVGIHPEYVKEITEKEQDAFLDIITENREKIVGIGEVGLDYNWVKEEQWQKKQRELFIKFIQFSKELKLPLIVHTREAYEDALTILEHEDARRVLMHMFGAHHLVQKIIENKWYISLNTMILTSKKYKKVARDIPLELVLLETDSPWLGLDKKRNDPTSVKVVAEKIAEIKHVSFEEVDKLTTKHSLEFFQLNLNRAT